MAASAIVAIAGVIGVLVVAYTSLYVWLNRTLPAMRPSRCWRTGIAG
jgi:hypothetical protein